MLGTQALGALAECPASALLQHSAGDDETQAASGARALKDHPHWHGDCAHRDGIMLQVASAVSYSVDAQASDSHPVEGY